MPSAYLSLPTPVVRFTFRGLSLYVKRDDLPDPWLGGNKFRKLFSLLSHERSALDTLISYGGTQSNAMVAIARLCALKGWGFEYHTKQPSAQALKEGSGNLAAALKMGMRLHDVSPAGWEEHIRRLHAPAFGTERTLLIPQGGADPLAREGIAALAGEIMRWKAAQGIGELDVVTPSGTGTTAYYLAHALPECRVVTAPAVGDRAYLAAQMEALGPLPTNLLVVEPLRRYRFATPHADLAAVHGDLARGGLLFDRLYAPLMFLALEAHRTSLAPTVLYVHSGGISGNGPMEARYRYKGIR